MDENRPPRRGPAPLTPAMLEQVRELALAHELQQKAYRARYGDAAPPMALPEPKRPRTLPPTLVAPLRTLASYHASRWPGSTSSLVARPAPRPTTPTPSPAARVMPAPATLPVWPRPSVASPPPPTVPVAAAVTPALLASLSNEQRRVLEVVRQGKSVFFTGCAGTGKSYLLKAIVAVLPEQTTHLTALTGVAALNIGGRTLHSFAGIGLGKKPKDELLRELSRSSRERWGQCRTLIIDEVSMMSDDLFDKIDHIARHVRHRPEVPFGGIQLVLTGDFFQLPPVAKGDDSGRFCFQSLAWAPAVPHMVELTRVFRQSDQAFVRLLSEVRQGRVTPATQTALQALARPLPTNAGIEPTKLFPTNVEVDGINTRRLNELPGDDIVFTATDTGVDETTLKNLDSACIAPRVLRLRPGAQVMLLRNVDGNHVNGSRGMVESIDPQTKLPSVRFLDGSVMVLDVHEWKYTNARGDVLASRTQIPLKLAWAITIHKSQGLTIDWLEVSLAAVFEVGQAYVALSRARSLDGLRVLSFDPRAVRAHGAVIDFYGRFATPGSVG